MSENNNTSRSGGTRPGFHVDPRFINLRPLAHGGNSLVYAATDSDCDKEVAIKKLSFCDRQGCKYALRELRLCCFFSQSIPSENTTLVIGTSHETE